MRRSGLEAEDFIYQLVIGIQMRVAIASNIALPILRTHDCDGLPCRSTNGTSSPPSPEGKCYLRLNRTYLDEFRDGTLSVARSVGAVCSTGVPPPPLLVIHGEADRSVPYANGEALFAHAAPPKRMLSIKKANHLLSNSTHFRKATNEIILFMHEHK